MTNDLISREALLAEYEWLKANTGAYNHAELDEHIERIKRAPAVDAVLLGVFEQMKWERDVAISQLNQLGVGFGVETDEMIKRVLRKADAEPVRHVGCALCKIKETRHGIIAYYAVGWEVCITQRDKSYYLVINHEGNQIDIPVDYCPNCGTRMDGENNG